MTESRPANIADTDVYITRAFAAPRETVFAFFTQPEHLASWFGPSGVHVPVDSVTVEARVGGRWELAMVDDATGERYPMIGTITEFVAPELLVVVSNADSGVGQLDNITLRIQFHDHGERTRVTLHQGPFTDEQRDMTAEGWELSFVKMDAIFAEAGK